MSEETKNPDVKSGSCCQPGSTGKCIDPKRLIIWLLTAFLFFSVGYWFAQSSMCQGKMCPMMQMKMCPVNPEQK